jgi:phage shock protein B
MFAIAALVIGILVIVLLALWIVLHHITLWVTGRKLSADDERMMGELWQTARRMETRIEQLERVLDAEAPGWRGRQGG